MKKVTTLKEQKTNIFVPGIVAVLAISLATPVAEAVLDVDAIVVTSCKNHLDGTAGITPWCFEVWVELVDSGSLDNINMTLPDGLTTYPLSEEHGEWYYDSSDYSSLGNLQGDYPTGEYTFDFRDGSSSLLTFELDYSSLSEPDNAVDLTYPSMNGQTGIDINPTFEWLIDSDDGDALYMWLDELGDGEGIWYENGPVSITTLLWAPGALLPARDYDLEVSVLNVKNLQPGPAFPTMTVGIDTFKYGLWIEYLNEIEFATVPEPATIALMGLGSLVLLYRRRK